MPYEFEIVVPAGKKKERLDVFLTNHVENATRNKVQRAIQGGTVLVGNRKVKPSHQVAPGEIIHITLSKSPPLEALPENIPIAVVYEDDDLLVVNKPAGMVTHPAYGNYTGTLVNALLHHCNRLSSLNDPTRPGVVHRLDKDTSGLMVVAKMLRKQMWLTQNLPANLQRERSSVSIGQLCGEHSGRSRE
jgi:23S rRNA pseudouridine1911/1915/1917 synthase